MRRALLIVWLALAAWVVSGQTVFITSNTIADLNPQRDALTATAGGIRITHTISDGDGPVTINQAVYLRLIDRRDSFTNSSTVATYTNQPGTLRWIIPTVAAGTNWLLYAEMTRPGDEVVAVFERWLTVTSPPAQTSVIDVDIAEGAVVVGGITNNINVDASISEGAFDGTVFNINNSTTVTGVVGIAVSEGETLGVTTNEGGVATITVPPGGSGGGIASLNGSTNAAHSFVGNTPIVVETSNGVTTVSMAQSSFIIIPPLSTGAIHTLDYAGSVTQQFVVNDAATTQLFFYVWGAGGGRGGLTLAGAGGFSHGIMTVTNGMVFDILVGQGGTTYKGATNVAPNGLSTNLTFPAGGLGDKNGNATMPCGNGGGRSQINLGTNIILIAGGGGGGGKTTTYAAGDGGGMLGGNGTALAVYAFPGTGGTQSSGGITNGAYLRGGNAVFFGSRAATSTGLGGGGDGYYGGGGPWSNDGNADGSGAGGSGYVNASFLRFGITLKGALGYPSGTDLPQYEFGIGMGGRSTAYTGSFPATLAEQGGHGRVVIYEMR